MNFLLAADCSLWKLFGSRHHHSGSEGGGGNVGVWGEMRNEQKSHILGSDFWQNTVSTHPVILQFCIILALEAGSRKEVQVNFLDLYFYATFSIEMTSWAGKELVARTSSFKVLNLAFTRQIKHNHLLSLHKYLFLIRNHRVSECLLLWYGQALKSSRLLKSPFVSQQGAGKGSCGFHWETVSVEEKTGEGNSSSDRKWDIG